MICGGDSSDERCCAGQEENRREGENVGKPQKCSYLDDLRWYDYKKKRSDMTFEKESPGNETMKRKMSVNEPKLITGHDLEKNV